jgi:F0F1-type ATP synthase epsilon subunit
MLHLEFSKGSCSIYKSRWAELHLAISSGTLEMKNNKVIVLVD